MGRWGQLAEEEVWRPEWRRGWGSRVSGSSGVGLGRGEASPQGGGGGCGRRLDALSRQGPGPRQLRAQILQGSRVVGLTSMGDGGSSPSHPRQKMGEGRTRTGRENTGTASCYFHFPAPSPTPPPLAPLGLGAMSAAGPTETSEHRQPEGHFLCMASPAKWAHLPTPPSKHLGAQSGGSSEDG